MALYKAVFDIFLFCFVYFILIRVLQTKINKSDEEKVSEVDVWLQEQNLAQYKSLFKESGTYNINVLYCNIFKCSL